MFECKRYVKNVYAYINDFYTLISIAVIRGWPIQYLMKTSIFLSLNSGGKFSQWPGRCSKNMWSTISFVPSRRS